MYFVYLQVPSQFQQSTYILGLFLGPTLCELLCSVLFSEDIQIHCKVSNNSQWPAIANVFGKISVLVLTIQKIKFLWWPLYVTWQTSIMLLPRPRYIGVLFSISFFLSFFVSLLAILRENGWTDLHEIFREGAEWPWDDLVQFWVNFEWNRAMPRCATRGRGLLCFSTTACYYWNNVTWCLQYFALREKAPIIRWLAR